MRAALPERARPRRVYVLYCGLLRIGELGYFQKVDLPARIHGSKGISAYLGTIFERHTENPASLCLDFREK